MVWGWGNQQEGEGARKEYLSGEAGSIWSIWRWHDKIHQTLFETERKKDRRTGNIREGVNLFKVHCTYIWNCHNEILSYY
jgi:hypothetical protein